jgi:serine/threonine protein kinase
VTADPADRTGPAVGLIAGRLFAERYRLDTVLASNAETPQESDSQVGQFWLAYDEVLARPVAILLVAREHPRVDAVLDQARAAARLAHPALVRVYDAGESDGIAYVVTEYLAGGSLEDRLIEGPLDPTPAVELVIEIGSGIAAANAIGLSRFDASPRTVLFTGAGEARLTGLGSSGVTPGREEVLAGESGEQADAASLASLLYAALTSRWPGRPSSSALPAAPVIDGHLRPPGLLRGGVPRDVDAIVVQALGDTQLRRGHLAIDTPAALVRALSDLSGNDASTDTYAADVSLAGSGQSGSNGGTGWWPPHLPVGGRARVAVVVVLVVMALAVVQFARQGSSNYFRFSTPQTVAAPEVTPTAAPRPDAAASTQPTSITIRSVVELDPYGDHKDPHFAEAKYADDASPTTAWRTQTYRSAALGNLKPGVGLLVDLGTAESVGSVSVTLLGNGTSVELFASDTTTPPTTETAMALVATDTDAPANAVLEPASPVSGRFWLIWLTRLPAVKAGFQGGVANISFSPSA